MAKIKKRIVRKKRVVLKKKGLPKIELKLKPKKKLVLAFELCPVHGIPYATYKDESQEHYNHLATNL